MNAAGQILLGAQAVLAALEIPWVLLGGWAVSVRTEPRFTRDVDLAVAVGSDAQSERVVGEFRARGNAVAMRVEQDAVHRLATAQAALHLIPARGYDRGRNLLAALNEARTFFQISE